MFSGGRMVLCNKEKGARVTLYRYRIDDLKEMSRQDLLAIMKILSGARVLYVPLPITEIDEEMSKYIPRALSLLMELAGEKGIRVEPLTVRIFNQRYSGKPLEYIISSEIQKAMEEIIREIRSHIPRRFYCVLPDGNIVDYNEVIGSEEGCMKLIEEKRPYGKVVIIIPDISHPETNEYYQGLFGLGQKEIRTARQYDRLEKLRGLGKMWEYGKKLRKILSQK